MPTHANRREFFTRIAAGSAALTAASRPGRAQSLSIEPGSDRLRKAYRTRMRLADYYMNMGEVPHPTNGDEERYSNKINSFSKTLLHDALGIVNREAYLSLERAIRSGLAEDFEAVLRGGNVRLKNPTGGYNLQMLGADGSQFTMRAAPAFASAEQAGEMVELYWEALTRDIPFAHYDSDPTIRQACQELSRMSDFRGPKQDGRVTPATIFRGARGNLVGPYISQFLLLPFRMGTTDVEQKQKSAVPGLEFLTDYSEWLGIQMGIGKGPGNKFEDTPRYIRNGRDLAHFVHYDSSFSPYYHALWIILKYGSLAYFAGNPYLYATGQEPYVNFGQTDSFDYVSRGAKPAFNAAWWQKWFIHKRARPEVFGGRVYHHSVKTAVYPIHDDVLGSHALEQTIRKFGTHLLAQAYSEGSPAHSAYPSGHATVAGACATLMKAFFREEYVVPEPVVASADGLRLEPYNGPELTIANELDKLAFNVAMGRNWAGIHWRTDATEGLQLGEDVAINLLRDMSSAYMDAFGGFTFTKFNGETITVCGEC